MPEIKIRNVDGQLVGIDPTTGDQVPVDFEDLVGDSVSTEVAHILTADGPIHSYEGVKDADWAFGTENYNTLVTRGDIHNDTGTEDGYIVWDDVHMAQRNLGADGEEMSELLTTFDGSTKLENSVPTTDGLTNDLIVQAYNGGVCRFMTRDGNGGVNDGRVPVATFDADGDPIQWRFGEALSTVLFNNGRMGITSGPGSGYSSRMSFEWMPYDAGRLSTIHDGSEVNQITFQQRGSGTQGSIDIGGGTRIRHPVWSEEPPFPSTGDEVIQDGTNWDPAGTGQEEKVCYLNGSWTQLS